LGDVRMTDIVASLRSGDVDLRLWYSLRTTLPKRYPSTGGLYLGRLE
jgi:hypothetical protein